MTLFWVVAACMVGAALLFVIPPLFLRRKSAAALERSRINITIYKNQLAELETDLAAGDVDQDHYDTSRQEIERRLLEDTAVAEKAVGDSGKTLNIATTVVVALVVPLVAVSVYLKVGNPDAINPQAQMAQQGGAGSPHGQGGDMQAQIEGMVGKLAQRLQENPSDIQGWVMLGRSFSVLGRYDEAVQAYEKAISVVGEDSNLLTDYADAIAMTNGESLEGKPMELLQKALKIDPQNQKALWLVGTAYFERGDFVSAINLWTRLQKLLPEGSEDAKSMAGNITEAQSYLERQRKGEFGQAPTPAVTSSEIPAAQASAKKGTSQVAGKVTLSPALASKVAPGDTLFVYAKAVSGPPMPLAIIRTQASVLPLEFKLDESNAAMPGMTLANASQVVVGARISKSGDAMPKSGDLQGMTQAVAVGSSGLTIQIDTVVP